MQIHRKQRISRCASTDDQVQAWLERVRERGETAEVQRETDSSGMWLARKPVAESAAQLYGNRSSIAGLRLA